MIGTSDPLIEIPCCVKCFYSVTFLVFNITVEIKTLTTDIIEKVNALKFFFTSYFSTPKDMQIVTNIKAIEIPASKYLFFSFIFLSPNLAVSKISRNVGSEQMIEQKNIKTIKPKTSDSKVLVFKIVAVIKINIAKRIDVNQSLSV